MAHINDNYSKLQAGYLFPEIGRRVRAFSEANPEAQIIRLGIGDVTLPLAPAIVEALHERTVTSSSPTPFASTTTGAAASRSRATRSSSPTAASRTAATSRRSSAPTARCR